MPATAPRRTPRPPPRTSSETATSAARRTTSATGRGRRQRLGPQPHHERAAGRPLRHDAEGHRRLGVAGRPGQQHGDHPGPARQPDQEAPARPQSRAGVGSTTSAASSQRRCRGDPGPTGRRAAPAAAAVPGAAGDGVDDVVVVQLGPLVPAGHQVQHVPVADLLGHQRPVGLDQAYRRGGAAPSRRAPDRGRRARRRRAAAASATARRPPRPSGSATSTRRVGAATVIRASPRADRPGHGTGSTVTDTPSGPGERVAVTVRLSSEAVTSNGSSSSTVKPAAGRAWA